MSTYNIPYQAVQINGDVLFAARGSTIDLFNLENGSRLSTWSSTTPSPGSTSVDSPPAKRRKLSREEGDTVDPDTQIQVTKEESNEIKKEMKQNSRANAVASGLEGPAVVCLKASTDGRYVVAVTAEDKSVRVFETMNNQGTPELKQISVRQMPKRPCSITFTQNSTMIICADKFGDVYSLPFHPSTTTSTSVSAAPEPSRLFKPAANELTIHSQRNLKALENQRRQQLQQVTTEKPEFERSLLLGHVSMLTCLTMVQVDGRDYILTADRDEHIRVSRGGQQAHVIVAFCLGHSQFVTCLCVPQTRHEVLISGGGEDELFVWEWLSGRLLHKVNLRQRIISLLKNFSESSVEKESASSQPIQMVVSGIMHMENSKDPNSIDVILVTVEGVPAIFVYHLSGNNNLIHAQDFILSGNPLAMASSNSMQSADQILVSIDTVHIAGSKTIRRELLDQPDHPFEVLELRDNRVVRRQHPGFERIQALRELKDAKLTSLLYGLETLRKRDGEEKDE